MTSKQFVGPDGYPSWCADDVQFHYAYRSDQNTVATAPEDMVIPFSFYLTVTVIYTLLDIVLSLATWSAASVGTPTEPRGRDKVLRTLIWIKITFMNVLLLVVLASGIFFVAEGRRTNYGCGEVNDGNSVEYFEVTSVCFVLISSCEYALTCLFYDRILHGIQCFAW